MGVADTRPGEVFLDCNTFFVNSEKNVSKMFEWNSNENNAGFTECVSLNLKICAFLQATSNYKLFRLIYFDE